MIQAAQLSANILQFPSISREPEHPLVRPGTSMSLRQYYQAMLLSSLQDLAPRSLESDRNALANWERYTSDPCIVTSSADELRDAVTEFRVNMTNAGRAATTINKNWRELKAIFEAAAEDGLCEVPLPKERRRGKRIKGKLLPEPPKIQRECITEDECNHLFSGCAAARYPACPGSVRRWRLLLYLFWMYGARPVDFIRRLRWDHILWHDRLLRFTAKKTSKLQGLPLTELGLSLFAQLRPRDATGRIFVGFNRAGFQCQSGKNKGKWRGGYYTSWRRDIVPSSGIETRVTFKHFRERVVTKYNAMHAGLGHWIAGHSVGALAAAYDLPTDQIRDVIEAAPVPSCFQW